MKIFFFYLNSFPAIHTLLSALSSACVLSNNMDLDQTAPFEAVWSGFIVFAASMVKVVWSASEYKQQT